jgi:hypothetical protein
MPDVRRTIVFAEDDRDAQLIYGTALQHAGFHIVIVEDGTAGFASAIDVTRRVIPALVVLDAQRAPGCLTTAAGLKHDPLTRDTGMSVAAYGLPRRTSWMSSAAILHHMCNRSSPKCTRSCAMSPGSICPSRTVSIDCPM